jgi:pimeloyl-ACP methyl ester carboxylesterase
MPSTMTTIDGFPIPVSITGPKKGSVVVVLGAAQRATAVYDVLCDRLHTASLRTVVVGSDPNLTVKSVIGILDSLDIQWSVVVGDRAGGELAWELAATRLDRFTGLVVLHYDQPAVTTVIEPQMTFTIEPMINLGGLDYEIWDDGWTVATKDGKWSAQFEHTLVVTDDGAEILTLP